MAILDLQRRLQEAGRIRIGQQVETRNGKKRPASLQTFRLTSPDRARIEAAAKLYGGEVKEWANNGRKEWEVVTETDRLPVVVPPSAMAFSQFMELWSGGGCQRRCDTQTEQIKEQPCVCDPVSPECTPHTRLSLMLSEVPGLGLWRLDTGGWNAARELGSAVETIAIAAGNGMMLPATLRLEQRTTKRLDEGTHHFVVPVLDLDVTPSQLITGELGQQSARAALTPVPVIDSKPQSIAQQVEQAKAIESRKRTASMPSTGVKPRTAAQARSHVESQPEAQAESQAVDPYADVPPPELPSTEQIMKTVTEVAQTVQKAFTPPDKVKTLLQQLVALLDGKGFVDKASKLDWCAAAVGHPLESASNLTLAELGTLIAMLTEDDEQIDEKLQKINDFYAVVSKDDMLADITQFLQLEKKLESLTELSDEDRDSILAALALRELKNAGEENVVTGNS